MLFQAAGRRSRNSLPRPISHGVNKTVLFITHPDRSRSLGFSDASPLLNLMLDEDPPPASSPEVLIRARCDYLAQLRDSLLSVNEVLSAQAAERFYTSRVAPTFFLRQRGKHFAFPALRASTIYPP